MTIRGNGVLVAIAAAGALFIGLLIIVRLPTLIALPIALVVGGVTLAVLSRRTSPAPVIAAAPVLATPDPSPPQYQAQPVVGISLPSVRADYPFNFSATVYWLPAVPAVTDPGMIAVSDIIRRARAITEQRDPADAALVMHDLVTLLAEVRSDPAERVHARAESVQLLVSADDQCRLEELARLRKEEELWDYRRQQEQNRRRYLSEDVLKSAGSAVVWWLARHDDQPEKVVQNIDVLTQLSRAANDADKHSAGDPSGHRDPARTPSPTNPQTPAEHFGAFVDALGLQDEDARLMLTKQVAMLVESHGYPAVAREMTGTYGDWFGNDSDMPRDEPEQNDW